MSHMQQQNYCKKVRKLFPEFFKNKIVLDIGSLDINGSNRNLFENCLYMGIDVGAGNNVDFISKGHEFNLPDNSVDVIISTECFEHDMYYEKTLRNIHRMLKPGGLFIFTCATTGRSEHGTKRTTPEDAFLLQSDPIWSDYYKNLTESDIRNVFMLENEFNNFYFDTNNESHDLYFYGFKIGEYEERNNFSFLMNNIININHGIIKLFYSQTTGFDKVNRLESTMVQNNTVYTFELPQVKFLRLDPLNKYCKIRIRKFILVDLSGNNTILNDYHHNGIEQNGYIYFYHNDSQVLFDNLVISDLVKYKFIADIEFFPITNEDLITYQNYILDLNQKYKIKTEELSRQNNAIINSKLWKLCRKSKLFFHFLGVKI